MPTNPTDYGEQIDAILKHLDTTKTVDNPNGNPFVPGGISLEEAKAKLQQLLQQVERNSRTKSYEAIHHIHMAHDWNETSQDLVNWLTGEQHDISRLQQLQSKQEGE